MSMWHVPVEEEQHPTNGELRKLVVEWVQWRRQTCPGTTMRAAQGAGNGTILDPEDRLYDAAVEIERQDNPPKKTPKEIISDWLNENAVSDERVDELVKALEGNDG